MSHYCFSGELHGPERCVCFCSPCKKHHLMLFNEELSRRIAEERYQAMESYRIRLAEEKISARKKYKKKNV